ncbi:MAG: GTP-binding protein [Clostridiales bacterium]|nr:GTP-binding protein [Clostridiales bacterium]
MDIPVFVVNGFLESGKSTFVLETINDPDFADGAKTLLIVCEEGEVEYDEADLKRKYVSVVTVEDQEELTTEFLEELKEKYKPDRVMFECNGMWNFEEFLEIDMPDGWQLAQIITIIDATTYTNYSNNFKAIMVGQFKYSDTIIVNRCTDSTDKIAIRRTIKPVNRKAQIIYESKDGVTTDAGEEVMPFDINADIIDICDDDYGLWYMNAMDHPKDYNGKTVRFRAFVYKPDRFPKGCFVPGRFAMTCCADDTAFIGFMCKMGKEIGPVTYDELRSRMWITITAKIRVEYYKEYGGKGPVLYATNVEHASEPEEKLVYFN